MIGDIVRYATNRRIISLWEKKDFSRIENTSIHISPQVSEGLVLRDGTRLKYPINGNVLNCLWSLLSFHFFKIIIDSYMFLNLS